MFIDLDHAGPKPCESPDLPDQIDRFPNLRAAGRELALVLDRYRHEKNLLVLAVALGGVPVAYEVAQFLAAPLDLIILRALLAPQGPGSLISAASVAGHLVLPDKLLPLPEKPSAPLEYFIAEAVAQLQERDRICRRRRPPLDLTGKLVLLVDCGAKTGLTMEAAIAALRTKEPERIIVAMPVVSASSYEILSNLTVELVCLAMPRPFGHVGLWYNDFTRPGDEAVGELLEARSVYSNKEQATGGG